MAWDYERARNRILRSISTAPHVRVESLNQYMPRMRTQYAQRGQAVPTENIIRDLGPGDAIVVDTVQVYVNVINYNEMRLEAGRETEQSHARALSFLHVHYASLDRVSDGAGAQRVDFHGPRMHTVYIEPDGKDLDGMQRTVRRALRLARETVELSEAGTRDIVRGLVPPKFRIGIDIGRCVALESGRASERDPVFVGPAANHAAKLADGDVEGIFVSDNVRALFGLSRLGTLQAERAQAMPSAILSSTIGDGYAINQTRVSQQIQALREQLRNHRDTTIGMDGFLFHYHRPPLRSIDFSELKPSNSIRMPLVSIFGDLDGYTRYIDHAMATSQVAEAVRDLHVIRGELNAVLQEDFSGRKVRFIGDCIHGLIAQGSNTQTDLKVSVEEATACVGALRSSFNLCLNHLPTAGNLGLAIGYELGPTPVSRIGLRGERAVRVANSLATLTSEQCQSDCTGEQTKIGPAAYAQASLETRRLFDGTRVGTNIDYDTVLMSAPSSASSAEPVAEARHHIRR